MNSGVVGIAGVGLIGSSIGLRAVELGWTVLGWDLDATHLRQARERGAFSLQVQSLDELARESDTLVLAAPLDATLAMLAELVANPPHATLVLDVASVKALVAQAGVRLANFVPSHPIAGSERSGPEAARADLFAGRVWTYDVNASPGARERLVRFIEAMRAAPLGIANAEHDRIVALTSHLPQLLSVALGTRLAPIVASEPAVASLCGSGVRSMLRLGASSWPMWEGILRANAAEVAQEVRGLADILTGFAEALESGCSGALAGRFDAAASTVVRLSANDAALVAVTSAQHVSDER